MAKLILHIELEWNGIVLLARPVFHSGWSDLTGRPRVKGRTVSTECSDQDDLSAFELGVFLAASTHQVLDEWSRAQSFRTDDRALFSALVALDATALEDLALFDTPESGADPDR